MAGKYWINFKPGKNGVAEFDGWGFDESPPIGTAIRFETPEARAEAFPQYAERMAAREIDKGLARADSRISREDKARAHACKYSEALLYESGAVTSPELLYHLHSESLRTGESLSAVARTIIEKQHESVPSETARLAARAQLRGKQGSGTER